MYWARHNWIHRFVKWGQIHQLVSGTFDFVERHELVEFLRIRTASCGGFFAKHFPKDKPTPKQYFALMHAVEFLPQNDFFGEGDEQPMESLHHEWNCLWVKSRHCVQRKVAVEHCLDSMHVKNNVKILVLAGGFRSVGGRGRGGGGGLPPPSHPAAQPPRRPATQPPSHPATLSPSHPTV